MARAKLPENHNKIPHPKKGAVIKAFCQLGTVSAACEVAQIDRTTHYDWLKTDPQYAEAFDQARSIAADSLEQEAIRRARDGWQEPVYQGGKLIGTVLKKSDVLLIFLLKGFKPEKFRERHEFSGPDGGAINLTVITGVPDSKRM